MFNSDYEMTTPELPADNLTAPGICSRLKIQHEITLNFLYRYFLYMRWKNE